MWRLSAGFAITAATPVALGSSGPGDPSGFRNAALDSTSLLKSSARGTTLDAVTTNGGGLSGPLTSPQIQAAFRLQEELNFEANIAAMKRYLGDRYANSWIDNDGVTAILNIGVVGVTPADMAYVAAHTSVSDSAETSVQLVNMTYSFSQLQSYQATLENLLESHSADMSNFVGLGIDARQDDLVLQVTTESQTLASQIQSLVPAAALTVQTGAQKAIPADGEFPGVNRNTFPPYKGGIWIQDSYGSCTAGFLLAKSGAIGAQRYGLTAGHCAYAGGPGTAGGQGTHISAPDGGNIGTYGTVNFSMQGDYAVIDLASGEHSSTGVIVTVSGISTSLIQNVTGYVRTIDETTGEFICHTGIASNDQCGTIHALDQSREYENVIVNGLGEASMLTLAGDSGGPVYTETRSGIAFLKAVGVLDASETGPYSLFTQIDDVLSRTGLTVATTAES